LREGEVIDVAGKRAELRSCLCPNGHHARCSFGEEMS
jgi:hypothetical protein